MPPEAPQNGKKPRTYSRHGLTALGKATETIERLGGRVLNPDTEVGRALNQWRADMVRDLGGVEAISTQQAALIELAVRSKLLLDSIDAWLLQQPSLINKRKRSLLPVVRERQALADGLARYLLALGLERRAQDVTDVAGALAAMRNGGANGRP